jgi:hypothetical protein
MGVQFIHMKTVYSLVDCLSDLGGLIEIVFVLSAYSIGSWVSHSYNLRTIQQLFLASTQDDNLFKESKQKADVKIDKIDIINII